MRVTTPRSTSPTPWAGAASRYRTTPSRLDPLVVVEVLSPSTRREPSLQARGLFPPDLGPPVPDVKTENRAVVRHRLDDDASIATRILRDGELDLVPPGISVKIATFFP